MSILAMFGEFFIKLLFQPDTPGTFNSYVGKVLAMVFTCLFVAWIISFIVSKIGVINGEYIHVRDKVNISWCWGFLVSCILCATAILLAWKNGTYDDAASFVPHWIAFGICLLFFLINFLKLKRNNQLLNRILRVKIR